jgi:hypothetical protein
MIYLIPQPPYEGKQPPKQLNRKLGGCQSRSVSFGREKIFSRVRNLDRSYRCLVAVPKSLFWFITIFFMYVVLYYFVFLKSKYFSEHLVL